ncbi:Dolichyl-phosphate-mannose-protein mannosyltransferase [Sulfobacillus thermosulfidooxidans DSM 9293]|uniref:Dolichyl-phosphate-mannose-protein mannosyltransferase n=1 Tax=Sulfobacillus thermosulfidooxidans (strain DSM 9293 / VKM B-1269 / AT-1) TaxID=929705 RepID=A0A1W1WLU4_SULTA|nr:PQQ-binding-like beta-propeller repeat protein [Sulfobacillus thermosulfidooxidans]SMC07226.1 Dolichyl-phosphate-mannose-protein mannosyltransferase [Sulfobacillus thermosulfidooxidans DSM 9293]
MISLSKEQTHRHLRLYPRLLPQWWVLIPIEMVAFLVRFIGLGRYHGLIYDEYYYVTAADVLIHHKPPVLVKHLVYGIDPNLLSAPPFAKEVIAAAIMTFGNHPWAWRLPGALLGAFVPIVVYALAQSIFHNRQVAGIAAGLSAVDGLMVSTSRLALLDSIAFPFVIWNLFILWRLYDDLHNDRWITRKTLWMFGITLGLGFSAKWIGAQSILMAWIIFALSWRRIWQSPRRVMYIASVTVIPLVVYFLTYAYAFPGGFHQSWLPQNVFLAWAKLQWLILKNMWTLQFYHPWTANAWTWLGLPRPTAYLWITGAHDTIRLLAFSNPLVIWLGLFSLLIMVGRDIKTAHRLRPPTLFFVVWFLVFYGTWLLTPRSKFNYYFLSMMPMLIMSTAYGMVQLFHIAQGRWRWLGLTEGLGVGITTLYLFPLWVGLPMPNGFYHSVFWSPTWNAKPKTTPPSTQSVSAHVMPITTKAAASFDAGASVPQEWSGFETGLQHNTVFNWDNPIPLQTGYILHTGPVADQPAVVGHDGFVGSNNNQLIAWNLLSGRRLWTDTLPNMVMTTPLVWKNEVIVGLGNKAFRSYSQTQGWLRGTGTNGLMAFNRITGKELWFTPTIGEDMPTPALQHGVIYEVTGTGQFLAVAATNGHVLWSLPLAGFDSMSSPIIDGNQLFVATNVYMKAYPASSSTVWDINLLTHQIVWHINLPVASGLSDNSPAIADNILYIAGVPRIVNLKTGQTWLNNELFAISTQNGHILWHHKTGGGLLPLDEEEEGIPFVAHHIVFIANPANRNLSAFDAKSGRLIWRTLLPASAVANPILQNSVLWIGLDNGMIVQIQASDGHIRVITQEGLGGFGPAALILFPHALLAASKTGNVAMIPVR